MSTAEEIVKILEGAEENEEEFESDDEIQFEQQATPLHRDSKIEWTSETFCPVIQDFNNIHAGARPDLNLHNQDSTELDFFLHFLNEREVEEIVRCTNLYEQNFIRNSDIRVSSRLNSWTDVTTEEMVIFLAITMLFTRNQRLTIEEQWSTDYLLNSPIFGNLMSRNRYCNILAMLHFADPSTQMQSSKLCKLQFLIDHCRKMFKETFNPNSKLCIDESMVPFKGRLVIKQYLPNKRNRFGIKLFVLCDVETGYIAEFIVYCGKETSVTMAPELGITGSIVDTLLADYLYCNRQLFVDNWYTSPRLSLHLKQKGVYACGTVRTNRKEMPKFTKIKKGEVQAFYSAPLMPLKWQDKKSVTVLSTMHDSGMIPTLKEDRTMGLPIMKPKCIDEYTKNMGSVDTADMMMSSITCIRKTRKWFKKLAFRLFDMQLLNAFSLYKVIKNKTQLHLADFQLAVCNRKSQRCKLCAMNQLRRQTRYMCKECNVYLCIDPCSQLFHIKSS